MHAFREMQRYQTTSGEKTETEKRTGTWEKISMRNPARGEDWVLHVVEKSLVEQLAASGDFASLDCFCNGAKERGCIRLLFGVCLG